MSCCCGNAPAALCCSVLPSVKQSHSTCVAYSAFLLLAVLAGCLMQSPELQQVGISRVRHTRKFIWNTVLVGKQYITGHLRLSSMRQPATLKTVISSIIIITHTRTCTADNHVQARLTDNEFYNFAADGLLARPRLQTHATARTLMHAHACMHVAHACSRC